MSNIRPALDTLRGLRRGKFMEELDEHFHTLVEAVAKQGRAGVLTIKLKVKPAERGENVLRVYIADTMTATVPEAERHPSLFYVDDHGNPSVKDPNQPDLPLAVRPVDPPVPVADRVPAPPAVDRPA